MIRSVIALATASLIAAVAVAQSTNPTAPARPAAPPTAPTKAPTGVAPTGGKVVSGHRPDASTLTIIETAKDFENLKMLTTLLTAASLSDTLNGKGPFTLFAPTNEAFSKLPRELLDSLMAAENQQRLAAILKYHVVPGNLKVADAMKLPYATTLAGQRVDLKSGSGTLMVDAATVTKADIICSNGVIHLIDSVLMPIEGNVIEVARGCGTFSTLLAAIDAAGMNDLFKGPGPYTILAPTDEAFRNLPKGTLADLMKPENKGKLAMVLGAHVVPGRAVYSDEIMKMKELQTVGGVPVKIEMKDGKCMIGGAALGKSDIEASNGVIQSINVVFIPASIGAKSTVGGESTKPDSR